MAVSTTSFSERLERIDSGHVKLFAGDDAPQLYKPGKLVAGKQKAKSTYWTAIFIGALLGAVAGYMFKTNVGIEMFFSQSVPVLFEIIKADHMTAAICIAMIAGPIGALGFLIFSRTKNRLAQFWWAYLSGSIGVNAQKWYAFYLTLAASA